MIKLGKSMFIYKYSFFFFCQKLLPNHLMWQNYMQFYFTCIIYSLYETYPTSLESKCFARQIKFAFWPSRVLDHSLVFSFLGTDPSELLDIFTSLNSVTVGSHYQRDVSIYSKSSQAVVQYTLFTTLFQFNATKKSLSSLLVAAALYQSTLPQTLSLILMNLIRASCITLGELICLHKFQMKGYYLI